MSAGNLQCLLPLTTILIDPIAPIASAEGTPAGLFILREGGVPADIADWVADHIAVDTWLRLLADLKAQEEPDLAMLSVALRAVRKLAVAAASDGCPSEIHPPTGT